MRKILTIIWTFVIVAILLLLLLKNLIVEKDKSKIILLDKNIINKNTDIFSVHTLDSLIANNKYVLLTLAFGNCSVCDIFLSNKIPDKFPVGRYYIDATYNNNNMLVLQSLYFTGFPFSYVIDQNYNIIGSIQGLAYFKERLDSIIYGQQKLQPKTIPGIPKDKTYFVLSNSFKGLLSYLENNNEDMKKYAEVSLSGGSFIFNNYLLYKYYKNLNCADSVYYYRNKIISNITHIEAFIYESLLTEIDPSNQMLYSTCNHTHN